MTDNKKETALDVILKTMMSRNREMKDFQFRHNLMEFIDAFIKEIDVDCLKQYKENYSELTSLAVVRPVADFVLDADTSPMEELEMPKCNYMGRYLANNIAQNLNRQIKAMGVPKIKINLNEEE